MISIYINFKLNLSTRIASKYINYWWFQRAYRLRIRWLSQKVLPDIHWDLEAGMRFGSITSLGQSLYLQSKWGILLLWKDIIFHGCLRNTKDTVSFSFPGKPYFSSFNFPRFALYLSRKQRAELPFQRRVSSSPFSI